MSVKKTAAEKAEKAAAVEKVAAEKEECAFFCRIQPVVQPDISAEARYPFAEIDPPAAYDDAGETCPFLKHG